MTKAELLRETLKHNVAIICFTKANGENRILMGTLQHKFIPTTNEDIVQNEHENLRDNGVVRIFDLTKKAWRSFNSESLLSFSLIDDYKQ